MLYRPRQDQRLMGVPSIYEPALMADKLIAAAANSSSSTAMEALISAFASTLHDAGFGHVLETVAMRLEERGYRSLAVAVRASMKQRNPPSEPLGG